MPYKPVVPEGQHLGTSRNVDGAVTGHLFDNETNELRGHAAWEWVDESNNEHSWEPEPYDSSESTPEEDSEWIELIATLIMAGTATAVIAATPRIKRWWTEMASPLLRAAWERVSAVVGKTSNRADTVKPSAMPSTELMTTTRALERAVVESRIKMRSSEWEQRFRAMLAAGVFKDEQLWILSNAKIEDDHTLESKSPKTQLTPQQFVDRIKVMLETNPLLLDEATSAELIRVFGAPMTPEKPEKPGEEDHDPAAHTVPPHENVEMLSDSPRALGDDKETKD
ncbi:hypothetical protein [Nesterenkonia sp. CF4.4]|uniref:hypothetical protein n=1 Tax=Nesterenkonia sp. CF4.4 TaxID=3373079 RepID=UPI003EE6E320